MYARLDLSLVSVSLQFCVNPRRSEAAGPLRDLSATTRFPSPLRSALHSFHLSSFVFGKAFTDAL